MGVSECAKHLSKNAVSFLKRQQVNKQSLFVQKAVNRTQKGGGVHWEKTAKLNQSVPGYMCHQVRQILEQGLILFANILKQSFPFYFGKGL